MLLPSALPDETLFSRLCRGVETSRVTANQYRKAVLGGERMSAHPFLASNLDKLKLPDGELVDDVVLQQTLLPFFAYYLPTYANIFYSRSSSLQMLTRACQFSTIRETDNLSAKYCPVCVYEDIYNFGVAYWHCHHQVPGVEACHAHGVWLGHYNLQGRSHLVGGYLPRSASASISPCNNIAGDFSKFAMGELEKIRNDPSERVGSYKQLLDQKGFITPHGNVRRQPLVQELRSVCTELFPESSPLLPSDSRDIKYWASLLSGCPNQHPFKHLVMNFVLMRMPDKSPVISALVSPSKKQDSGSLCRALLDENLSYSEIARRIKKSRCYVKGVALRFGQTERLSPTILTKELISKVVNMAKKGFHREAIARRYGISSGSVEMLISTTEGLVAWRKQCRFESKQRRSKCQIIRYMQCHPNAIRQEVKSNCQAAFFWLYKHSKEWLNTSLPKKSKTRQVERVDWAKRDSELAVKVRDLLKCRKFRSRAELEITLGSHGWLTSKKSKLPKTMMIMKLFKIN
ncbi:TnsD family Tn7-like transposition protein [Veronia pacifica]|uniref:Uncharacterized protein n=1 Tax=Veronia pacifica TaxID=1080227 RepID=A0A1C3E4N6_9GAMM|nr:TnsD family Tn7-like transposition protein [Veronia pacifica]ODA28194.1 hypothetical protein A8L45_23255 [Veronia pacifica]